MAERLSRGDWVILTQPIFDDEQQAERGAVGRVLRYDNFLVVVDFSGDHIVVNPSRLLSLNGEQRAFGNALGKIVKALQMFDIVRKGDPLHLYSAGINNLLAAAQKALNSDCPPAATELQMSITHLGHYCSDQMTYYTSREYFRKHIHTAISFLLGLSGH